MSGHHNQIADAHEALARRIIELETCLKAAVTALEWYADWGNYFEGDAVEWHGPAAFDDPSVDFDYDFGGRARASLATIKTVDNQS